MLWEKQIYVFFQIELFPQMSGEHLLLAENDSSQKWFIASSARGDVYDPDPSSTPTNSSSTLVSVVTQWTLGPMMLTGTSLTAPEQPWWKPHYKSSLDNIRAGWHSSKARISAPYRLLPMLEWDSSHSTWACLYQHSWFSTERLAVSSCRLFAHQVLTGSMSRAKLLVFSTLASYSPLRNLENITKTNVYYKMLLYNGLK